MENDWDWVKKHAPVSGLSSKQRVRFGITACSITADYKVELKL